MLNRVGILIHSHSHILVLFRAQILEDFLNPGSDPEKKNS